MHGIPFPGPFLWMANFAFSAILPCVLMALGFLLSKLLGLAPGQPSETARDTRSPFALFMFITLAGLVPAFLFHGSFLGTILVVAGAIWFLMPCLLVLVVLIARSWMEGAGINAKLKTFAFVWCACAGGLLIMWTVGQSLHDSRVNSARAYVARAVPVLEAMKSRTGIYPAQLPVTELGKPPALLQGPGSYSASDSEFEFSYEDDAGMMDSYIFDSASRTWRFRG